MTDIRHSLIEKRGAVLTVILNRPEVMNALHPEAHAELASIFDDFARDDDLRLAVITGSGDRAFCTGSDLKVRAETGADDMPTSGFAGLTERFDLTKPVIAAVNGHAIGGGLEVLLACDLVIAVEDAKFGLPEPKVGLAASGGLHRLARQIPLKQAMEIALTGRLFSSEEAITYGLINSVVPRSKLAAETKLWTNRLLENAPLSLRATKQMMLKGLDAPTVAAAFTTRYPEYEAMLKSIDAKEGPRAFSEKRKPQWLGK
ncbi:enoyl-CoA hydratase-related protein [Pelagibius sp. Alg239-R121]|uniref:enoyl-CoA hydratase-related protein n=1 Tax=Pelagibius sp. Alg239-R121 TaxID=2993448 RepID=UPI0024A6D2FA|nr:enoyl-CoA hydratase-related protein [Pelagibius sp. Alg239-R121]